MTALGIPPQVVADWTPYQLRMVVAGEEDLTGNVKMTKQQVQKYLAERKLKKELRLVGFSRRMKHG